MQRISILMAILLMALALSTPAVAQKKEAPKIPTVVEGVLYIYEVENLLCSMYVNEDGMGKGATGISCVYVAGPPKPFRILQVIPTTER